VRKCHIYKDVTQIRLDEERFSKFNVQDWFFKNYRKLYKIVSNPLKPRSFEENDIKYINQFPDFIHSKTRRFSEFDESIQDKVKNKVLMHIHKIWCSGKRDLTTYTFDWLAHMINGEKINTALYLKSVPGTGKSIICQFILEKVLGPRMVYKTSDPDQVAGKFNSAIVGRLLLYLEEMPKKSNLEWTAIADRFKDLIDGRRIDINEKGKPSYNTDNNASIIVNTNRNSVRIDTTDRRWVFLDVSDERVGDHKYFDDLGECLEIPEVGEAFFAYMYKRAKAKPEWVRKEAKKIPRTDTKQEQIVRNLDNLYIFIKEHYIRNKIGLDISQMKLYGKYSRIYGERAHDKYTVGSMMASIGFKRDSKYLTQKRINNTRQRFYIISYDELYALYDKKGWIHSIDQEEYGLDEIDKITESVKEESAKEISEAPQEPKELDPALIPLPESPKIEPVSDPQEDPVPIERSKEDEVKFYTNDLIEELYKRITEIWHKCKAWEARDGYP